MQYGIVTEQGIAFEPGPGCEDEGRRSNAVVVIIPHDGGNIVADDFRGAPGYDNEQIRVDDLDRVFYLFFKTFGPAENDLFFGNAAHRD